ncbi:hypothetical protein Tco_1088496, partial [Tanacetum coccineum]
SSPSLLLALRKDLIPNHPRPVATEVVTGEAIGVGTNGDDGETGKEPNDHSGDGGV